MNAPFRQPRIKTVTERLKKLIDAVNIADNLDGDKLSEIGAQVCRDYDIDLNSNDKWRASAERSLKIALQAAEAKSYPFKGASNVKYPLITVAALQFNARAYPAIVDGNEVVKAKVIGSDKGIPIIDQNTGQQGIDPQTGQPAWQQKPGAKRDRAERISRHMSYQLTEQMEEWEEDTDTLLMQLPIVGTAFRKVYYDPSLGRNKSEMVSGLDVVVNRSVRSLETAPRITQRLNVYPGEIEERQRAGMWRKEFEPGQATNDQGDEDAPHEFLEQHRLLDLDEDGYREPYIVTVHRESQEVVRIRANYGVDDVVMAATEVQRIERRDFFVMYGFIPDPNNGFYHIGFGSLLEGLSAAIDTTINQMLDAGHLQVAGGGFIGSGVRLKQSEIRLQPGTYRTVSVPGAVLRDAIYNMEHPGPSNVLFSLLGMLIDAAKDITAVQDILTGDTKDANQTATTTLALIEQGMKVFTAIYKRIYRSLKREFKLLYRLNAENLEDETYFQILDEQEAIARSDYEEGDYDVCPVADPRLVTDMQRLARAQALMATLEFNQEARIPILEEYYQALGVDDVDRFFPPPQPNPMAEEAAAAELRGKNASAMKDEALAGKAASEAQFAGADRVLEAAQLDQEERQFQARRADDAAAREDEKEET